MLTSLIYERQALRDSAVEEVSSKWGGQQEIGGPVLSIPYTVITRDSKGNEESSIAYAHFLPENLQITGSMTPEKRYRGIFMVMLYNAKLHVTGKFSAPDLAALNVSESNYRFQDASICIGISDMKGINENISFKVADTVYSFHPGLPMHDIFSSGASFELPIDLKSSFDFSFDLNLNGSTSISFLPLGKETKVELQSPWNSPSFEGSFLPDQRDITDKGFTASWKVLHLNRNYPQQGLGNFISENDPQNASPFGVRLVVPIDEYQKTNRSVKYCLMFIVITFITFFFIEVLNKKRIHPIQYLIVGLSICLFYVLLLSISEHLKFDYAYLIGSVSILGLISFYIWNIFKSVFLTTLFTMILALLYGFFYSLLQLEDFALLLGSIGLFAILATIIYLTRKIDWYSISTSEDEVKK